MRERKKKLFIWFYQEMMIYILRTFEQVFKVEKMLS